MAKSRTSSGASNDSPFDTASFIAANTDPAAAEPVTPATPAGAGPTDPFGTGGPAGLELLPLPDTDPQPLDSSGLLDDAAVRAFARSDKGRKLAAWVVAEYKRTRDLRRPVERQWLLNIAMYSGRQYVEWETSPQKPGGQLIDQKVTSQYTPRIVINKIQPIIRTEMSKLVGQKPTATVMPASTDDADMFAAEAGEQVWDALYARLGFPAKFSQEVFWLSMTGNGFFKTYWDAGAYDADSAAEGDIAWRALSPWHVLVPDLLEPDIECQPWVFSAEDRPTEWVNDTYGSFFAGPVKATANAGNDEIIRAASLGIVGGGKNGREVDMTTIIEAWIKPNNLKELPDGGMVTVIDGVIVQAAVAGLPYDHKEYPFAHTKHIPTGTFYATSSIEALIPLQREYNRTQSQIIEAKNKTSKPQSYYREGSLDPSKVTTAPGLMIPIRGSAEYPQQVTPPPLPAYVINFNERMQSDFEDLSGQHAATRGTAPSGMAATAIAYLQEQDDAYLALTFQSIEQTIQKVARQSLVLAATYWDTPRLIKAVGDDQGFDAILLKGSQIANSTDIRIDQGSALSQSKAAKSAQVEDWMKMGWITPQDGFELMDMPMVQSWLNRNKVDKKAAQVENIMFRALDPNAIQQKIDDWTDMVEAANPDPGTLGIGGVGDPSQPGGDPMVSAPATDVNGEPVMPPLAIPVNDWDDHNIHILVHNLWRKSPSYRLVPMAIKAEVEAHVQAHKDALVSLQMQAAGGLPPEPGMVDPTATVDPNNPDAAGAPGGEQGAPVAAPEAPGAPPIQ